MKNIVKAISGSGLLIAGAILSLASSGKGAIISFAVIVIGIIFILFANTSNDNDSEKRPSNEESVDQPDSESASSRKGSN